MTETTTTHAATDAGAGDPAADVASLMQMIAGGAILQTLHAVAELNIADHLADGARTAKEVAEREGSHERSTFRLMRAAASLGVLSYEGSGRFGLTGRGQMLRSDVPGSLRSLVLIQAGESHWQPWSLFPEAVRQGTSQAKKALGADVFDYYARPEKADEAKLFAESMRDLAGMVTQGILAEADTKGLSTAIDVGGGDGHLVLALMEANSALQGQVLDLPHAIDDALQQAERRGLSDRFSGVPGDFFDEVPSADLYLLKTVLHDWDDERCTTILRNCRSAAGEGGRALVVEMLVDQEIGKPDFATIADVTMLCVTGGIERDLDEFDALFEATCWRRGKTYPVGGGYFAMELEAI
ncbi:methyltransferase [Streptomyces sp. CA-288835]|uniref:methyltransferase n=1 Tax=Streptomyces sp. CA-288835 TaxID=3240069 RepID=UPI003D92587B